MIPFSFSNIFLSCVTILENPLKAKGFGVEARSEGPFLKCQNCSGKAAKQANGAGSEGAVRQLAWAGRVGKACGQGAVPLLATRLVDIAFSGDIPAVVFTRVKAITRRSLGTQTEVPQTHSYTGLWLQGVPEPGTRTRGQQSQQLCSVRPGE